MSDREVKSDMVDKFFEVVSSNEKIARIDNMAKNDLINYYLKKNEINEINEIKKTKSSLLTMSADKIKSLIYSEEIDDEIEEIDDEIKEEEKKKKLLTVDKVEIGTNTLYRLNTIGVWGIEKLWTATVKDYSGVDIRGVSADMRDIPANQKELKKFWGMKYKEDPETWDKICGGVIAYGLLMGTMFKNRADYNAKYPIDAQEKKIRSLSSDTGHIQTSELIHIDEKVPNKVKTKSNFIDGLIDGSK
jgi:hypothetical protein